MAHSESNDGISRIHRGKFDGMLAAAAIIVSDINLTARQCKIKIICK